MREIELFVSHARIAVCSASPGASAALDALAVLWRSCRAPLVEPTRAARIEIRSASAAPFAGDSPQYEIALDGELAHATERKQDLLPLIESVIYRVLHEGELGCALLHAACVQYEDSALVLVGPSGAGKSSFALAAVQRGYRYLTDELTVTDGVRVWGVPRSIQFEAMRSADVLPARLAQSDRELYPVRLEDDDDAQDAVGAVPVRSVLPHELAPQPCAARRAHVVRIARADACEYEPLSPLAALAELHEASFARPNIALGALVGPGRGHRLSWSEPQAALERLERELTRSGTWP